jgi:hypothetical protein
MELSQMVPQPEGLQRPPDHPSVLVDVLGHCDFYLDHLPSQDGRQRLEGTFPWAS